MISISFGSFPEVSCFSLEHILHCVCIYFQEVGISATSFLNLKKLPGARMSGVDCGPGQSCSRCEGWGSQGSAESALPGQLKLKVKASWGIRGFFCRGHPGKTAAATGSLGGKSHSSMCKGGQASHLECPEMLCPCHLVLQLKPQSMLSRSTQCVLGPQAHRSSRPARSLSTSTPSRCRSVNRDTLQRL